MLNKIIENEKIEMPPDGIAQEWIRVMTATTPLQVLGFQKTPNSKDDIREAYGGLAMRLHPDKIRNLPDRWRNLANQAMVKLTDAYSDLTNAEEMYLAD